MCVAVAEAEQSVEMLIIPDKVFDVTFLDADDVCAHEIENEEKLVRKCVLWEFVETTKYAMMLKKRGRTVFWHLLFS